jgi:hypothetical protein
MIRRGYEKAIAPGGRCAGGCVFLWGRKQEATATWFGVFTEQDEATATADVLQELWTGKAPANRAPELESLKCNVTTLKPSEEFTAEVEASDPEGDVLRFHWEITDDLKHPGPDGCELPPDVMHGLILANGARAAIKAPDKPGPYRVFVFVSDGRGHAATANVPVLVK